MVCAPGIRTDTVDKYIIGLGSSNPGLHPYEIMLNHLDMLKRLPPDEHPVPQKVRFTKINGINFLQAKQDFRQSLAKAKTTIYICIDSFEDFFFDTLTDSASIGGLLRCLGAFTAEVGPVVLRCCIPAEQYFAYLKASSNPIKDFQGQILLHWDSGDLFKICAERYQTFSDFMAKIGVSVHYKQWMSVADSAPLSSGARSCRPMFIREQVFLNRLYHIYYDIPTTASSLDIDTERNFVSRIRSDGRLADISSERIVQGVRSAESLLAAQIIQAYSQPSRTKEQISEALRFLVSNLNTHFTWSISTNYSMAKRRE